MNASANTEKELVARAKELQVTANVTSWDLADTYAELKVAGWTVRKIAQECETNKSSVGRFIQIVSHYWDKENRPSFWEAFQKAVHVSQNTGQPEWHTPPDYIDAARAVLGRIDLDPATSKIAQQTVRAERYFTADDDGLAHPWAGRVWLNPPYSSDLVGQFVTKLCEHYEAGDVSAALLLVNNATETEWFQQAAKQCASKCFPDGRIRFLDEHGKPGAPLQGQAVLYFGQSVDTFVREFSSFGVWDLSGEKFHKYLAFGQMSECRIEDLHLKE